MPVAKDTVMKYFHQIPDSDSQWKCVCGKVLSQKKSGFTNLFNNIKSQHPEYAETNQPKTASCFLTVPQKLSYRRNTSKHAELELGHIALQ